jgi:hypothetical protein
MTRFLVLIHSHPSSIPPIAIESEGVITDRCHQQRVEEDRLGYFSIVRDLYIEDDRTDVIDGRINHYRIIEEVV